MKRLGTLIGTIGVAAALLWQSAAAVQQAPQGRGGRGMTAKWRGIFLRHCRGLTS